MAVSSNSFPLGTTAPAFKLQDVVTGKEIKLDEIKSGKATVIMFLCNHCPYVKHILQCLVNVANEYKKKDVSFAAISSNEIVNYPEDSPEKMKEAAEQYGFEFPYLFDETQNVARAYDAACTPEFYVFDIDLKCIYHGQFDDSRPSNTIEVTGNDLCNALDNVLAGKSVNPDQKPGIGCSIKWKH